MTTVHRYHEAKSVEQKTEILHWCILIFYFILFFVLPHQSVVEDDHWLFHIRSTHFPSLSMTEIQSAMPGYFSDY
jgi:hypothetical protein